MADVVVVVEDVLVLVVDVVVDDVLAVDELVSVDAVVEGAAALGVPLVEEVVGSDDVEKNW